MRRLIPRTSDRAQNSHMAIKGVPCTHRIQCSQRRSSQRREAGSGSWTSADLVRDHTCAGAQPAARGIRPFRSSAASYGESVASKCDVENQSPKRYRSRPGGVPDDSMPTPLSPAGVTRGALSIPERKLAPRRLPAKVDEQARSVEGALRVDEAFHHLSRDLLAWN